VKPAQVDPADALAAEADELSRRAERAQAKARDATAARTAEQSARRQDFDRAWLAAFDDAALEAEQSAALAAFEAALAVDPVASAWLEVARLRLRRHNMGQTAVSFASGLGVQAPVSWVSRDAALMSDAAQRAVESLAGRLEGERTAELYEARERAATDAAEGGA